MTPYQKFIAAKNAMFVADPVIATKHKPNKLFPFQQSLVNWALAKGRSAIFADCGLGKTLMQLEWAANVNGRAIIFAPLGVAKQTEREAIYFDYPARYQRDPVDDCKIVITNYELQHKFHPEDYNAIVLDESSILKNVDGKTKRDMCERWALKYRLACSATPSPNDFIELQSHSEFLGLLSADEMMARFFINDGNQTQKYRLKGHAEDKFWDWVCQWGIFIRKPSDIGFSDEGYDLPNLNIHHHIVSTNCNMDGFLFHMPAATLSERSNARSRTVADRASKVAELVNGSDEQWLIWCGLNKESESLANNIDGAIEVRGSDTVEHKEDALIGFAEGRHSRLITKPTIAGFGMNFQSCHNMAFVGLSDSYEQFYQAVRRCYRFGQTHDVDAHIVMSDIEGVVARNIARKEDQADEFYKQMSVRAKDAVKDLSSNKTTRVTYHTFKPAMFKFD